jgi:hypothetical protein
MRDGAGPGHRDEGRVDERGRFLDCPLIEGLSRKPANGRSSGCPHSSIIQTRVDPTACSSGCRIEPRLHSRRRAPRARIRAGNASRCSLGESRCRAAPSGHSPFWGRRDRAIKIVCMQARMPDPQIPALLALFLYIQYASSLQKWGEGSPRTVAFFHPKCLAALEMIFLRFGRNSSGGPGHFRVSPSSDGGRNASQAAHLDRLDRSWTCTASASLDIAAGVDRNRAAPYGMQPTGGRPARLDGGCRL